MEGVFFPGTEPSWPHPTPGGLCEVTAQDGGWLGAELSRTGGDDGAQPSTLGAATRPYRD
jgi:hypothetical protein